MKKYYFILLLLLCSMSGLAQDIVSNQPSMVFIEFHLQTTDYHDYIKDGEKKRPRTPVYAPNVGITENTLFLLSGCDNTTLSLIDNTGTEIFTTFVQEGTTTITLSTCLSGTYELRIVRGNYMFVGEIEL